MYLHTCLSMQSIVLQVLAMARPWQCNVEQHRIPEQFKAADIGMVLNLQV